MPPDAARVAEARPWFVKAEHDLRAADVLLAATPPLLGEAAYHCQQAAEKSLKGFLSWHDIPFSKTHDLAVIGGFERRARVVASLPATVLREGKLLHAA